MLSPSKSELFDFGTIGITFSTFEWKDRDNVATTRSSLSYITMQLSSSRALLRCVAHSSKGLGRPQLRRLATAVDRSVEPTDYDQVTRLPNGVRVATEALPGPFAGVGVYVDAGSRYENEDLRGVSHIVDRLAFKVCPE